MGNLVSSGCRRGERTRERTASNRKAERISRRMTLGTPMAADSRTYSGFLAESEENDADDGGHLLWIITRREPPFNAPTRLQTWYPPRRIRTFLLILIPLLLLCSLSPLFLRQVNNSSSFTYPTPEFIMEIILFVLKSRFSPRQSPSPSTVETTSGVKKKRVNRRRGEKRV